MYFDMRTRRINKLFRKDDQLGIRLPKTDKDRLVRLAREDRRDPSDMAWLLLVRAMDQHEGIAAPPHGQEAR